MRRRGRQRLHRRDSSPAAHLLPVGFERTDTPATPFEYQEYGDQIVGKLVPIAYGSAVNEIATFDQQKLPEALSEPWIT